MSSKRKSDFRSSPSHNKCALLKPVDYDTNTNTATTTAFTSSAQMTSEVLAVFVWFAAISLGMTCLYESMNVFSCEALIRKKSSGWMDFLFKMYTDKQFLEAFIKCYESHRPLWDSAAPEYQMREKKDTGYKELLKIYKHYKEDAKMDDVKRKINSIRCGYRRELKKIKQSEAIGGENGLVYRPVLWWFPLMDFVRHFERSPAEDTPSICMMEPREETCEIGSSENSYENDEVFPASPSKKCKLSTQEEMLSIACNYLSRESDIYDKMAQIWADKLRNLPKTQRLIAEKGINDIIFEGEMETLTRNSVQILPNLDTPTFEQHFRSFSA